MITIALSNQKGGCSKTSSAHALGIGLANRGYRVLFVDLDAQCNLTDYCGIDADTEKTTIYEVLGNNASIQDAIKTIRVNVDIVVGSILLSSADCHFLHIGKELMIKEKLEMVADKYDFCIIDTPPTLGLMTTNALSSADFSIVPITPSRYSLKGIMQLRDFSNRIKKYINPKLRIIGILATKYNPRLTVTKHIMQDLDEIAQVIDAELFDSKIRQSAKLEESQYLQQDIYATKSDVANDYNQFVDEFLERVKNYGIAETN